MNECQELQPSLSAHLDGALPEDESLRLDEHLAGCLDCQAERAALEQVAEQVRGLPRLEVPAHFTAGVMAQVIEEPSASTAPAAAQKPVPMAKIVEETGDAPDLILPEVSGDEADEGVADDAFAFVCRQFAEDRSALLDNALPRGAITKLRRHLANCEACRTDQEALQRLRDRVGALPGIDVPPDFAQGVMDKIDAWEFGRQQREQEARAQRLQSMKMLGWVAQAAGFLVILTGGMYYASPETPNRAAYRDPGFKFDQRVQAKRAEAPPPAPPPRPPLRRGDAEWELTVASLEQGHQTTRSMASRFAQIHDYRDVEGEEQRTSGFLLNIARNQIDDMHASLDQAQEVQTNAESLREMQRFHTEQDQVVLKSGFVLVGTLQRQDRSGVRIVSGGSLRQVASKDVERVERANEKKTLRILLHERD